MTVQRQRSQILNASRVGHDPSRTNLQQSRVLLILGAEPGTIARRLVL